MTHKKNLICVTIVLIIVLCDLVSKDLVFNFLITQPLPIYKVTSFFNLALVMNSGVSFGMFSSIGNGVLILTILGTIISAGIIYYIAQNNDLYKKCALSIILGGAIGNISDRLICGAVRDFLDFHIATYHWPAFNIADSAICCGACLYLLLDYSIFKR